MWIVALQLQTLTRDDFEPLVNYYAEEAARYKVGLRHPIEVQLGDVVKEIPPALPNVGSTFGAIIRSLKFLWFTWNNSSKVHVRPDIRMYLLYYNLAISPALVHSPALNKGRIGRVNLFGSSIYAKQNLVIFGHELLHTLTATDKYDLSTNCLFTQIVLLNLKISALSARFC